MNRHEIVLEVWLSVTTNGYDWSSSKNILYTRKHSVFSISPRSGSLIGKTQVVVTGENFLSSNQLSCRFGRKLARAEFLSSTKIICDSPEFADFGGNFTVPLEVTLNGLDFSSNQVMYSYTALLAIKSVTPGFGPSSGGTNVTITFKALPSETLISPLMLLSSSIYCKFDIKIVPASVTGPFQISCLTPPIHASGEVVRLEVSFNGQDWTDDEFSFVFIPGHMNELITLSPNHGPTHGGTPVRIEGFAGISIKGGFDSGFELSQSALCKFGDVVFPALEIASNGTYVICKSPQASDNILNNPFAVNVDVSLNGALENFLSLGVVYTYDPIVQISKLVPKRGPHMGNFPVKIVGGPFFEVGNELMCRFGVTKVNALWVSSSVIECIAPAYEMVNTENSTLVPVSVSISLNGGYDFSVYKDDLFYYVPIYKIVTMSPTNGPIYGGTTIFVQVSHSLPTSSSSVLFCHFEGPEYSEDDLKYVVPVSSYINATCFVCITPPSLKAGKFNVLVSMDSSTHLFATYDDYSKYGAKFIYDERIIIMGLYPSLGPILGDFPVKVIGGPFLDHFQIHCRFGNIIVNGRRHNNHEVECIAPANSIGNKRFSISVNGLDFSTTDLKFVYHDEIELDYLQPKLGPGTKAGTVISIRGKGFENSTHLACKFESVLVPAQFISSHFIMCKSPPTDILKMKWLSISSLISSSRSAESLLWGAHDYPLYFGKLLDVEVTNNGQDFSGAYLSYFAHQDVEIIEIHNDAGPLIGGTPVFLSGNGFVNTTQLKCRFGYNVVQAHFLTRSCVLCFSPPHVFRQSSTFERSLFIANRQEENLHDLSPPWPGNGTDVIIEVSNNVFDFSSDGRVFHYYKTWESGLYHAGVETVSLLITFVRGH